MNPTAIAVNRFGLGIRADEAVPADGHGWLLAQIERFEPFPPAWSAQPGTQALIAEYVEQQRSLRDAPEPERAAMRQAFERRAREVYVAAAGARTVSALDTATPFAERLVHFWANHFAVSTEQRLVAALAGAFELDAIRPHVMGRFEDMLVAVTRHPAMLLYLDQAASVGPNSQAALRLAQRAGARRRGLNENLAREILELHTLGVRSGYTQADVVEFARALTGWGVSAPAAPRLAAVLRAETNPADVPGFEYHPALHEPGPRTIVGRIYADTGEGQAMAVLRDLATAPPTARHIALKLARHFVADDPPPAVIERLATAFQRSGGDLPTVYRALVDSPEPWAGGPAKFKTPWDWAVSSLRALGRREVPGQQIVNVMNQLGQPVWRPGSPAGFDDLASSWAAPDALLRRVELAQRLAAQAGDAVDARALAPRVLPGALGDATAGAIARAESAGSAVALLLVSPEFLRR